MQVSSKEARKHAYSGYMHRFMNNERQLLAFPDFSFFDLYNIPSSSQDTIFVKAKEENPS